MSNSTFASLPAIRSALICRRTADPAFLDRLADAELQLGHVAAAERLAHLAAEIRAGGATA